MVWKDTFIFGEFTFSPTMMATEQESDVQGLADIVLKDAQSENLADLAETYAELGLDSLMEEGILKDIPFVGTAVKLYQVGAGLRNAVFAKKLIRFLISLKNIPFEERRKFVSSLGDADYRKKVGERLITIIDRLDNTEKADVIGKLFGASISGHISYEVFLRLSIIVDRGFLPDLLKLKAHPSKWSYYEKATREHFASIGIMSVSIDAKGNRRTWGGDEPQPEVKYHINDVGLLLAKYGLGAEVNTLGGLR